MAIDLSVNRFRSAAVTALLALSLLLPACGSDSELALGETPDSSTTTTIAGTTTTTASTTTSTTEAGGSQAEGLHRLRVGDAIDLGGGSIELVDVNDGRCREICVWEGPFDTSWRVLPEKTEFVLNGVEQVGHGDSPSHEFSSSGVDWTVTVVGYSPLEEPLWVEIRLDMEQ